MARQVALVLFLLLPAACHRSPDSYPPPKQQPAYNAPPVTSQPAIVELSGAKVDEHIVRDVWLGDSAAPWRWTKKSPLLKVMVHGTVGLKFVVDYAVPEVTFKYTGPVNIKFLINDQTVGAVHVTTPGQHHFEQAVVDSWLRPGEENQLGAEIDRMWTDPANGTQYGFILSAIGLARM